MQSDPIPSTGLASAGGSAIGTGGATRPAASAIGEAAAPPADATQEDGGSDNPGGAVVGADGLAFPPNFVFSKGQREELARRRQANEDAQKKAQQGED